MVIKKIGINKVIFLATLLFALVLGDARLVQAQAKYDDEPLEYIFQVVLHPGWMIKDAAFAYEWKGKYYLPILELSEGFEFFAQIEPGRHYVTGFASQENNNFMIDGDRGELIIQGQKYDLPEDAILTTGNLATDDLYISMDILNRIWPVQMAIDLSQLTISVKAEENLSFMREKLRKEKQDKTLGRQGRKTKQGELPWLDNPYRILGKPIIDYQAIYSFDDAQDKIAGQNIFSGRQQIAGMIADYSGTITMEDDGDFVRPDSVRLKFERRSMGKDYLVPGVRRFELGDVSMPQKDLVSGTSTGRGVILTNDNIVILNNFVTSQVFRWFFRRIVFVF